MGKPFVQTGKIKVLFFDMNGTLLDPDRTFRESFRTVWEDTAGRWDDEEKPDEEELWLKYDTLWKKTAAAAKGKNTAGKKRLNPDCLSGALESLGIRWKAAMVQSFIRKVKEEQERRPWLIPGAAETVEALAKRYRIAVISNGSKERLLRQLKASGLLSCIPGELVFASNEAGVKKPGAGIFRKALRGAGVRCNQALMIGNSWKNDILGAAGIGMDAVWIHPGHQKKSSRRKIGGSRVLIVRKLEQMPDNL